MRTLQFIIIHKYKISDEEQRSFGVIKEKKYFFFLIFNLHII